MYYSFHNDLTSVINDAYYVNVIRVERIVDIRSKYILILFSTNLYQWNLQKFLISRFSFIYFTTRQKKK